MCLFFFFACLSSSPHVPETTIKLVVSATWGRTTPVCAPETTIKTVVSGTAPQNMSSFLIYSLFGFCRFLFLAWCVWNHYFCSGFRHTTKTHRGVWPWNHYKNSGFRHSAQKHVSPREAKNVENAWRNLALCRSTQTYFDKVSFFFYFYAPRPETPIFVVFSRRSKATSAKKQFSKNLEKNRDKKKSAFSTYSSAFLCATKPLFL